MDSDERPVLAEARLLAAGGDAGPCAESSAAVCFTGATGERCFPTVGMCRAGRESVTTGSVTDCEDAE